MPRARGGKRAGAPGKAYSNRSDLNTTRTLPVTAASNQQYGQRAAQEASQKVVPLARQPQAPSSPASPASGSQQGAGAPVVRPAPPGLLAPSGRPDEPLTAGAPFGPGSNDLNLPLPPAASGPTVDQDQVDMAAYLPTLELMAEMPNSTVQFRNWVRRLRGGAPRLDV